MAYTNGTSIGRFTLVDTATNTWKADDLWALTEDVAISFYQNGIPTNDPDNATTTPAIIQFTHEAHFDHYGGHRTPALSDFTITQAVNNGDVVLADGIYDMDTLHSLGYSDHIEVEYGYIDDAGIYWNDWLTTPNTAVYGQNTVVLTGTTQLVVRDGVAILVNAEVGAYYDNYDYASDSKFADAYNLIFGSAGQTVTIAYGGAYETIGPRIDLESLNLFGENPVDLSDVSEDWPTISVSGNTVEEGGNISFTVSIAGGPVGHDITFDATTFIGTSSDFINGFISGL